MPSLLTAPAVLDRVYLEVRAKLLEVAASLDRIDRGEDAETLAADPRLRQIHDAIAVLQGDDPDRAERIQMIFSDPYVAGWLAKLPRR